MSHINVVIYSLCVKLTTLSYHMTHHGRVGIVEFSEWPLHVLQSATCMISFKVPPTPVVAEVDAPVTE